MLGTGLVQGSVVDSVRKGDCLHSRCTQNTELGTSAAQTREEVEKRKGQHVLD